MPLMGRTTIASFIGVALVVGIETGSLFSFGSKATIGWVVGIVDAIFPQMITVGWKIRMERYETLSSTYMSYESNKWTNSYM